MKTVIDLLEHLIHLREEGSDDMRPIFNDAISTILNAPGYWPAIKPFIAANPRWVNWLTDDAHVRKLFVANQKVMLVYLAEKGRSSHHLFKLLSQENQMDPAVQAVMKLVESREQFYAALKKTDPK